MTRNVSAALGLTLLPLPYDAIRAGMAQSAARPVRPCKRTKDVPGLPVAPADENALSAGLNLHLALKRLAQAHNLDAFAAECWTGLPREIVLTHPGFAEDAYTMPARRRALCVSLLMSNISLAAGPLWATCTTCTWTA